MSRPEAIVPTVAESLRRTAKPPYRTLDDAVSGAPRAGGQDTSENVHDLAQCAADLIVAVTGVDLSGLAMFEPSGWARMMAACHHRSPEWANLIIEPGDGVAGQVVKKGGMVTLKNYAQEAGTSEHLVDVFARQESAYGMLAVPIEQSGSIVGVVYGGVRRPEYIGDRGRLGLNNVARLFSATLLPCETADGEHAGEACHSDDPEGHSLALATAIPGALSARERRMLQLLADGMSTREVAAAEYIAVNTVRSYVQSALWKLGAHSRLQAVAIARDAGLI